MYLHKHTYNQHTEKSLIRYVIIFWGLLLMPLRLLCCIGVLERQYRVRISILDNTYFRLLSCLVLLTYIPLYAIYIMCISIDLCVESQWYKVLL